MANRSGKIIIPLALMLIIGSDPVQAQELATKKETVFSTNLTDWAVIDPAELPSLTAKNQYYLVQESIPEHSMVPLPPAILGTASLGILYLVRRGYKTAIKIKRNRSRFI